MISFLILINFIALFLSAEVLNVLEKILGIIQTLQITKNYII
jgi:hypothetical protein